MYYKRKNKYLFAWILVLLGSLLLTTIGCDSLLPEKLQDKQYDTPAVDQDACHWLSLPDTLYNSLACKIQSRTLQSCLAGADTIWKDSTDNKIINATFNRLADSLKTLVRDSLLLINYPASEDTVYTVLNVTSGQAGSVNLYTSLEYYYDDSSRTTNINEYVTIELLKQDTAIVSSSVDMLPESLTGCTAEVLIAQNERIVPVIRARYEVHLAEGVYLVRFILSNWLTIAKIKTVREVKVRDYYFKVIIL